MLSVRNVANSITNILQISFILKYSPLNPKCFYVKKWTFTTYTNFSIKFALTHFKLQNVLEHLENNSQKHFILFSCVCSIRFNEFSQTTLICLHKNKKRTICYSHYLVLLFSDWVKVPICVPDLSPVDFLFLLAIL